LVPTANEHTREIFALGSRTASPSVAGGFARSMSSYAGHDMFNIPSQPVSSFSEIDGKLVRELLAKEKRGYLNANASGPLGWKGWMPVLWPV
jgi:hypothetical protein